MAITTYNCDSLTGGAARSLDLLSVGALTNGDRAVVMTTAASYHFKYNSTGTAAEQATLAPRVIRPDDYSTGGNWEEYVAAVEIKGTWTMAFTAGTSGTITIDPSWDTASYIKMGSQVTINGHAVVSTVNSPVGLLTITGLPYASQAGTKGSGSAAVSLACYNLNTTGATSMVGYIPSGAIYIAIFHFADGSYDNAAADMKAGSEILFSATYMV